MSSQVLEQKKNSTMRKISVEKVVINIGVGKSGDAIERAKRVLEQITRQTPSARRAKKSIRDFGVHQGEPIGLVVTVRREATRELISNLLAAREKKLSPSSFDDRGSVSFGVKEHIEIPGVKYDPEIGIFGMNVSVLLVRPGQRISRRLRRTSRVGLEQKVSKEEAIEFFKKEFGAVIE
jgi:large subunit ribosomal protein L5